MTAQTSDHVSFRLNRVLATFGFHKHLDQYGVAQFDNFLTVFYTDVPGNHLKIQCMVTPAGRTTVKATFNQSRTRAWEDLEVFFDQIEGMIEVWKSGKDEPPEGPIETVRPGKQRRRYKAREILSDVKAGMDDAGLMAKYDLNAKGILDLMNKLLWHGLLTPEELADRRSLARTVYLPIFKCRSCGDLQFTKLNVCPKCKGKMIPANESVVD